MATTSITITKEAYHFLESVKGKKSFSETILSLTRTPRTLLQYAGAFKGLNVDAKKLREDMNRDWTNRD